MTIVDGAFCRAVGRKYPGALWPVSSCREKVVANPNVNILNNALHGGTLDAVPYKMSRKAGGERGAMTSAKRATKPAAKKIGPVASAPNVRSDENFEREVRDEFSKLGISHFPAFTNSHDFAQRFERCSLLITENIEFSTASSASIEPKIGKKFGC
jgi:hypothetical protein